MIWVILILLFFYLNLIVAAELCLSEMHEAELFPDSKSFQFTLAKFLGNFIMAGIFGAIVVVLAIFCAVCEKLANKIKTYNIKLT